MQLVHVRQNDNTLKTPQVRNQKEFAFLINCRSLLENGFSIFNAMSKSICPFQGRLSGKSLPMGLKVTLRFSIFHPLGALMFGNSDTIRFVVLFEIDSLEQAGVNILIPAGDQSLEDIVTSFSESKLESKQQLCLDRITKPIRGVQYLSVCLRKKMSKGEKLYVVDITKSKSKT